jgi:hypothetical protein
VAKLADATGLSPVITLCDVRVQVSPRLLMQIREKFYELPKRGPYYRYILMPDFYFSCDKCNLKIWAFGSSEDFFNSLKCNHEDDKMATKFSKILDTQQTRFDALQYFALLSEQEQQDFLNESQELRDEAKKFGVEPKENVLKVAVQTDNAAYPVVHRLLMEITKGFFEAIVTDLKFYDRNEGYCPKDGNDLKEIVARLRQPTGPNAADSGQQTEN